MLVFRSGDLEKDRPCSVCHAPTHDPRHIVSYDGDGEESHYDRLCRRCLEAEKAYSRTIFVFEGEYVAEIFANHKDLVPRPGRKKQRVA